MLLLLFRMRVMCVRDLEDHGPGSFSFITSLFLVRLDSRSRFFPFLPCATGASELAEFEPPFGFQPCLQLEYSFGNALGPGVDVLVLSVSLLQTVQLFSTFI